MRFRAIVILSLILIPLGLLAQAPSPAPAPPPAANPSEKGWTAYKAGDFGAAMTAARDALKTAPGDPRVLELFGRCSMAVAEPSAATGALNMLCGKRGTEADFRLLAAAYEMAGKASESRQALEKAEKGKEPTAEGLYQIAYRKGDGVSRTALLKRIAADFPAKAPALAPEIAFWEARGSAPLLSASEVPAAGASLEMKTLYNAEWLPCKVPAGDDLWLLQDTASPTTVLSKEAAERLKLAVVPLAMPISGYPQAAGTGMAVVDRLDFGTVQFSNVPVLVVDDASGLLLYREGRAVLKGILGMDLLRGFKFRLDRQKNQMRVFPKDAPASAMLEGDAASWKEAPAFILSDQVVVKSAVGARASALGLLTTACSLVLVPEGALAGTGLNPDSKKIIDLTAAGELELNKEGTSGSFFSTGVGGGAHSSVGQARKVILGWMDVALPLVGKVRTVPKASEVGFGGGKFQINDLPLYPQPMGDPVPASVIVGKKITDFFALAFDLQAGKIYFKQVLFAK